MPGVNPVRQMLKYAKRSRRVRDCLQTADNLLNKFYACGLNTAPEFVKFAP